MSTASAPKTGPLKVKIVGMDCGSCAMTIESSISKLPGVDQASVSFTTESMEVLGDVSMETIERRLKDLGYKIGRDEPQVAADLEEKRGLAGFLLFLWDQPPLRNAVCVAAVVFVSMLLLPGQAPIFGVEPLDAVFAAAVLIAGAPVFFKGLRALFFARRITIDLLMVIASIGAVGIGEYGEAVTVIMLFMLGEALEAYSAERARDSLRSLLSLQPQEAIVLQAHTDALDHEHEHEHEHDCGHDQDHAQAHSQEGGKSGVHAAPAHDHSVIVPVEQVAIGDRVLVRPGQRIPIDGEVISGVSSVDQAPVTGESMPVPKVEGDIVMAGTVNGEAALEVRATKIAAEGTIARIARLVEQAQAQHSPAERFIDRFARWYTPLVVALAALVVIIPVYGFGQPLLSTGETTGWLYRGLTMLIIACPCALVISIPVTVVSGLTRLANLGVLVKGGAQLDCLADIKAVAFDKTGTLTYGRPRISGVRAIDCGHPAANSDDCGECDNVVAIAASLERSSEHPVAHAIVAAAQDRNGVGHLEHAQDVLALPGKGVSGELAGSRKIVVGSSDLFSPEMAGWGDVDVHAEAARENGETVMYISENDRILGYIGVHDEVREITHDALADLSALGVRNVMLTGDHQKAGDRVAAQVTGIDEVRSQMLPADKLNAIQEIHDKYGAVAMVGDGINDAPALAQADIGIAMGDGGTAQAMETADVVLMRDDLTGVALALRMAKKSRAVVKQNIILSLALKVAFLGLAIPGLATLWMAVVADVGATLLVTLNGMRLLREK